MSFKYTTSLKNFRYNSFTRDFLPKVDWFYYETSEDNEGEIRGFTAAERDRIKDYFVSVKNFDGDKNYSVVNTEALPFISDFDFEDERIKAPDFLILKSDPDLTHNHLSRFMEIVLMNGIDSELQNDDLPFGIVGKILL